MRPLQTLPRTWEILHGKRRGFRGTSRETSTAVASSANTALVKLAPFKNQAILLRCRCGTSHPTSSTPLRDHEFKLYHVHDRLSQTPYIHPRLRSRSGRQQLLLHALLSPHHGPVHRSTSRLEPTRADFLSSPSPTIPTGHWAKPAGTRLISKSDNGLRCTSYLKLRWNVLLRKRRWERSISCAHEDTEEPLLHNMHC